MNTNLLNELVDEAKSLLTYAEFYDAKETTIRDIISDSITAKGKRLLPLFENNPNYNGRMQIVFRNKFTRNMNPDATKSFISEINSKLWWNKDVQAFEAINLLLRDLEMSEEIEEDTATCLNESLLTKFRKGQKISKVVGKICSKYGFDNEQGYNRKYAEFCDNARTKTAERTVVISANPIDFLTMSNGVSWSSCMNIKNGNGYRGESKAGTISYMRDSSTFMVYILPDQREANVPELCEKIERILYHYQNGKIIRGRLYPQAFDNENDYHRLEFDQIVRDNVINFSKEDNTSEILELLEWKGLAYPDPFHFTRVCKAFYTDGEDARRKMKIKVGESSKCVVCGKTILRSNSLYCRNCR